MNRLKATLRKAFWRLGRTVYMRARGEDISGDMLQNGEAYLIQQVVANVRGSGQLIAIDIGANQGCWTKLLLDELNSANLRSELFRIYAFEPVPSTAEMLRDRLSAVSGKENVKFHQIALSDAVGLAKIGVFADGAGTNSLYYSADQRDPMTIVEVNQDTLDDFCARNSLGKVTLIKCDTEGNDARVLHGAKRLLKEERVDVIQFEYNHRWVFGRSFLKDVFDLIEKSSYKVCRVEPCSVTVFDDWHPELERFFQSNYAVIHHRALSWFTLTSGCFDRSNTYA